jgi:hypothetical protein
VPQINSLLESDNEKDIFPTQEKKQIQPPKDKFVFVGVIVVGVLLIFSGMIYALSSVNYWRGKESVSVLTTASSSKPKTQEDRIRNDLGDTPSWINGSFTSPASEGIWKNRSPLGVMINNHVDARPQSCLNNADIVYEAVAEGGITRFLAIFHTKDCEKLGPVRSARVYFEDWLAEYNGIYAHWGAAYQDKNDPSVTYPEADAYLKVNELNMPDLDQMWVGDLAYWREDRPGKATEHTGYTATGKLWEAFKIKYPENDWRIVLPFDSWKFKNDIEVAKRPQKGVLDFNFWDSITGYNVRWEYIPESNSYRRYQSNEVIKDADTGNEIEAKNVIVQFQKETSVGDKKNHLLYQTLGTGEAQIYCDGQKINAVWSKQSPRSRTKYFDLAGNPVELVRGQIWVEIVPSGNTVSYQTS